MTKEEAIEVLLKVRPCIIDNAQEDALDLAIEALSKSSVPSDVEEKSEKSTASNENLNFALDKYIGNLDEELHKEGCTYEFDWDDITETIREVGSYFAKWQKEQMMSEAVEGLFWNTPFPTICLDDCKDYNFKDNQKLRIIIIKEDSYE